MIREHREILVGKNYRINFNFINNEQEILRIVIWHRTWPDEGTEGEPEEWELISDGHFRSDHPTKLARALNELTPMDEEAQ